MTALPAINLLPMARRHALSKRRRVRLWAIGVGVYGVLLAAGWASFATAHRVTRSDAEQLASTRARIQTLIAEAERAESQGNELRAKLEAARSVGRHPDWSMLLRRVAPGDETLMLDQCLLRVKPESAAPTAAKAALVRPAGADGYTLTLSGLASSQAAVTGYVRGLEDLRVFEKVSIAEIRRYDGPARPGVELFTFRIDATLSDAGAARSGQPASSKGGRP